MSPTLTSIQGFFQKQCYALLHQLAMDLFLPTPITPPDKRRASKKKKKNYKFWACQKKSGDSVPLADVCSSMAITGFIMVPPGE